MSRAAYYSRNQSWSRSAGAAEAERNGRLPLTRAVAAVAAAAGCTHKQARAALLSLGTSERHHVGKFANRVNYYDITAACGYLAAQPKIASLPADWSERLDAAVRRGGDSMEARIRARDAVLADLAAKSGFAADEICNWYYEIWAD